MSASDLIGEAIRRRKSVLDAGTDAVRLIDGAGDGFPPGVALEAFADRLLISTLERKIPAELEAWLWSSGRPVYWKQLDQHQKASPAHWCGPVSDGAFPASENGMIFEISFSAGYSQGIFLDQRDNRAEVRRAAARNMTLLNTFAYTGAFSVAAAVAGAETTTLDLSQPYLDWAKRNFSLNGLDPAVHHFCKGDTFHWLRRFAKQGRKFDLIVLDPPTFSRDEKGRVFRVEKDFGMLAELAAKVAGRGGRLLCSNNFRRMTPREFEAQLRRALPRNVSIRHTPMPCDFTDEPYLKSVWVTLP